MKLFGRSVHITRMVSKIRSSGELCIWLAASLRGAHVFEDFFKELNHTLRDTEKRGVAGCLRIVLFLVQHHSQLRNDFNQR
jgi:hypothetical protein